MNVALQELPDNSRLWIFQSSRPLDAEERKILLDMTGSFLSQWTAHQQQLKAGCDLLDGLFLLIAVDEQYTGASGCSLDKLHQFVKEAGRQLSIDLLGRLNVAVLQDDAPSWRQIRLPELEKMLSTGAVSGDERVADVNIQTLGEFRAGFKKRIQETWLNRYLPA